MAEVYGYFNGLEYDEKFPMMRVASLIPTGVYNDSLHVSAGMGLTVYVAAGKAWVNGYFYSSDATKQITIDIADADNTRKDIIVLRLDTVNRLMEVAYKKGNPSVYPTPPTLQRNNDLYELQLAEILVPAGSASISAATITDTRSDSGLCGITAGFQGLDVAGLTTQAQAQFDAWFNAMKGQLSTDAAGNLQNQIDAHKADKNNPHGVTAQQAGAVPTGRKINGYDLSVDRTLTAADVGALKEEIGSWTPSIAFSGGGGVTSYSYIFGSYVKRGKLVTVMFNVEPTAKSGSGLLLLSGLPFPLATGNREGSIPLSYYNGLTKNGYGLFLSPQTTSIFLFRDWSQGSFANLTDAAISLSSTYIAGTFSYLTT